MNERPATRFEDLDPDPRHVPEEERRPVLAPVEDLRVSALAHYERVSLAAGEWSNQVPQAIDHWYREHFRRRRSRWEPILAALIAGFVAGFLVASLIATSRTEERAAMLSVSRQSTVTSRDAVDRRLGERVPRTTVGGSSTTVAGTRLLSGVASWYDDGPGRYGAAGPVLRAALGGDPAFRGRYVSVCASGRCTTVVLRDWCQCGSRNGQPTLVDLSPSAFGDLGALSRGVLSVTIQVTSAPVLPQTDTVE